MLKELVNLNYQFITSGCELPGKESLQPEANSLASAAVIGLDQAVTSLKNPATFMLSLQTPNLIHVGLNR